MAMLVDVHAHLDAAEFDADVDAVIERAKKAGIVAVISNGLNPEGNRKVLALAKKYDIVKAALGLYPTDVLKMSESGIDKEIAFIEKHEKQTIAIGEIGLDYKWVKDQNEKQQVVFRKMLELAKRLEKPILVHSRDAEEDTIRMIEESGIKKVVMHCFGGNMKLVERVAKNSWSFSIPTNVVFSSHFQSIVKKVDVSQLLTETDAPFLGPEKGVRNEPANIAVSVKKIAEVKKMDAVEMENVLYMNYQRLFL